MANVYYDKDATDAIKQMKVCIVGYGSQGHAQAQNLRDSGVDVRIGLNAGNPDIAKAEAAGFKVDRVGSLAKECDVIMILAPDTIQPAIYREEIEPAMGPGKALMFAHGFNIRFNTIAPPKAVDVVMVAPKGPGHRVRETFVEGGGVPALIAVHQDGSGKAREIAMSYAKAIGAGRAGILETTFSEETETDLFGEQVVLCGGVSELVKAAFETLTDAGYQPEIAYFECMHELKLIVDLLYRGGLNYMRYSVSDTAEYGDYESGRRVISDSTREEMKQILAEIKSGEFAKRWIAENQGGCPKFEARRREEQDHPIEQVGARLRKLMPFVDPIEIKAGD